MKKVIRANRARIDGEFVIVERYFSKLIRTIYIFLLLSSLIAIYLFFESALEINYFLDKDKINNTRILLYIFTPSLIISILSFFAIPKSREIYAVPKKNLVALKKSKKFFKETVSVVFDGEKFILNDMIDNEELKNKKYIKEEEKDNKIKVPIEKEISILEEIIGKKSKEKSKSIFYANLISLFFTLVSFRLIELEIYYISIPVILYLLINIDNFLSMLRVKENWYGGNKEEVIEIIKYLNKKSNNDDNGKNNKERKIYPKKVKADYIVSGSLEGI